MSETNGKIQFLMGHFEISPDKGYGVNSLLELLKVDVLSLRTAFQEAAVPAYWHERKKFVKGSDLIDFLLIDYDYNFNKDYLSIKDMIKEYEPLITPSDFRKNNFDSLRVKHLTINPKANTSKAFKYHKSDIEAYLKEKYGELPLNKLDEYSSLTAVSNNVGCSPEFISVRLDKIKHIKQKRNIRIHKGEIPKIQKMYDQENKIKELTPIELLEYKINSHKLSSKFPLTKDLYLQYATIYVNNSQAKKKRNLANDFIGMYKDLINSLTKEVNELSDNELILFFKSDSQSYRSKRLLPAFFKWVSQASPQVSYNNVPTVRQKQNPNESETYTAKEFYDMYDYVNNLEVHRAKAIKQYNYAQAWFVLCMNFTNAWRTTDLWEFPSPNLKLLNEQVTLEWFKTNTLTVADSQKIVNEIIESNHFIINKTGALNSLYVHQDILVTFVTALCITEMHRQKESLEYLLPIVRTGSYSKKINTMFPHDFPKYSYKKVTKSLLTNLDREARNTSSLGSVSNVLSSRLRGHKDPNTIALYIGMDEVNHPLEVSKHLFRRGHFGYLYSLLVDLINPDKEFTLEEKTQEIEKLKKYFTPIQVENNSRFIEIQRQRQDKITELVINMDNQSILEKLNAVYNDTQPAKISNAQCLSDKCINEKSDCLNCPLLLPKVFMLQELKEEIEDLLTTLQNCESTESPITQKAMYLVLNRLNLIGDARKTFGKEYINAFIELDELQMKLNQIQNKILLEEI
ncbi:hypothetical protein [Solibacillus sp. FSL K6-1126]|uniref:hypothetical protein n=1 Tax=Solibacillus sp. FSL K6-1126 TaxID=2921463 RepID=UPI0030F75EC4